MATCYILFSERIQSFYVGFTTEPIDVRLDRHNSGYYHDKWTSRGVPWKVFLIIPCTNAAQARKIEAHIKKMKSKSYIQNLKKYPEMIDRLIEKYAGNPDC